MDENLENKCQMFTLKLHQPKMTTAEFACTFLQYFNSFALDATIGILK